MEAARPRGRRRPPRRGTVDRPLNARLVRVSSLIVVPALLALLFSVSATGTLPRPPLEPLFDQDTAASLADELTSQSPSRVPGTQGDVDAALLVQRVDLGSSASRSSEDVWTEDIPELGRVELRNVVAVIPGRSDRAMLLVAHRDNAGVTRPLRRQRLGHRCTHRARARLRAPGAAETPRPQRTLVLVSTDGGAYGGAGAARFAEQSPYADAAFAASRPRRHRGRRPSADRDRWRRRRARPHRRSCARRSRASRSRRGPSPTSPASRHSSSTSASRSRTRSRAGCSPRASRP